MSRTTNNKIIDTLGILSEGYKSIHLTDDAIREIVDYNQYFHVFENVEDFREPGKTVYKLSDLLLIIFIALFELHKPSYLQIADRIETKKNIYSEYGIIHNGKIPSHDTIRRVLSKINSESLYNETIVGLYNFLKSMEKHVMKSGMYSHIGVDGKENRGSGRASNTLHSHRNLAHLNVYDSGTATCLYCEQINEKENEIPISQKILRTMNLKKTVVTADALHCQRETTSIIHDNKGIYVFTVKDNQQLLNDEITARITNLKNRINVIEREKRIFEIYHLPKNYAVDGFKGMKTFIRMTSKTRKGRSPCIRNMIANTNDEELICEAIESRWMIENDFHREKDRIFGEDYFTGTDTGANKNITLLNNLGLQFIKMYQTITNKELRKAKDYFRVYPVKGISTVLSVMSSEEIVNDLIKQLDKQRKAK